MNDDLIRRAAMFDAMREEEFQTFVPLDEIDAVIDKIPAVDAEPVRHAKWDPTNDDNKKRCSRCDIIHLIAQYPHGQANYCPNCGAKMDGGVKG